MRVFVTGATGFIGSAIVRELIGAGHQVLGLARSDKAAASLSAAGAEVHHGSLNDLKSLQSGAAAADGVIHAGFVHDFSDMAGACEIDRRAIETLGTALAGSGRPLVITSGTALVAPGRVVTEEDDKPDPNVVTALRFASEVTALALVNQDVRVSIVRLPPSVHGEGDHGFVPQLIEVARSKGVAAYVGDGLNRWAAVHRLDAAHLFRLALESAPAGSRLHGVGEEGVLIRDIAGVIGQHLNVPVTAISIDEATNHFGWLGNILAMDTPASSTLTRERLGWNPVQQGLIADLDQPYYYKS